MTQTYEKPPSKRGRWERVSELVIVLGILLIAAYDLLPAFFDRTPGDTISEVMRRWSHQWWCLPAGWACLAGHWWGPPVPAWWPVWSWVPLLVAAVVMVGMCWAQVWVVTVWWEWWMIMAVWAPAGAGGWPLKRGGAL